MPNRYNNEYHFAGAAAKSDNLAKTVTTGKKWQKLYVLDRQKHNSAFQHMRPPKLSQIMRKPPALIVQTNGWGTEGASEKIVAFVRLTLIILLYKITNFVINSLGFPAYATTKIVPNNAKKSCTDSAD